jgi:DUF1680 family protein
MGLLFIIGGCGTKTKPDYPVTPVPFTAVHFDDAFWAPRIETNRAVTIPFAFKQCEETGRVANFEIAGGSRKGRFCTAKAYDDSDVYKVIEGASYSLAQHPDPRLDQYLDRLIEKIAAAQEADGYLYTARTINPAAPLEMSGKERWSNLKDSHELYNLGHLYEAAVAHFQVTGKRALLNVALKSADFIDRTFGPGKRKDVPGHQEIEIGLVKLYRLTDNEKYVKLAKFFLDERGNAKGHKLYGEYSQDHIPVIEQTEAAGHAVRAVYMYSGIADVAALTGDQNYVKALDRLWENVVSKKLYLTGGIGAAGDWEGFGPNFELPNDSAYAETCAAIANALWNYRMFLLRGEAKYVDVFEKILYNGLLSGIALSGDRFFYPNPLSSSGQHERSTWFTTACCPSNITRFMPSIPGYIYAVAGEKLHINLYVQGTAEVRIKDQLVRIDQSTEYPWNGDIKVHLAPERPENFTLCLRIPGWAQDQPLPGDLYRYVVTSSSAKPSLRVNGEVYPLSVEKGFAAISRRWEKGDAVQLTLPMSIHRVIANEAVQADRGRVAVEKGPLVYCAEWADNGGHVANLMLDDNSSLTVEARPELLRGLDTLSAEATAYLSKGNKTVSRKQKLILIPYYAWAHRGKGEMTVWIPREPDKVCPLPEPAIAPKKR